MFTRALKSFVFFSFTPFVFFVMSECLLFYKRLVSMECRLCQNSFFLWFVTMLHSLSQLQLFIHLTTGNLSTNR